MTKGLKRVTRAGSLGSGMTVVARDAAADKRSIVLVPRRLRAMRAGIVGWIGALAIKDGP